MRYWELISEDELQALSAFIHKWRDENTPMPIIIARAKRRRDNLATARVLAQGQQHWRQLLKAADKAHGPISAKIKPLAAPQSPSGKRARYTSSGLIYTPAQSP